ncbi:MAG: hypothetical protein II272_01875, partial [Oscillospiraceae bacterium]|nr:hypothetical protein [Oscillospiraceae bacterium]
FDDEIPFGDEIRLDGGWVDLISSAKQISSERSEDADDIQGYALIYLRKCTIINLQINKNLQVEKEVK